MPGEAIEAVMDEMHTMAPPDPRNGIAARQVKNVESSVAPRPARQSSSVVRVARARGVTAAAGHDDVEPAAEPLARLGHGLDRRCRI